MNDRVTIPTLDLSAPVLGPRLARFLAAEWGCAVQLDGWQRFPAGFSWTTVGVRARTVEQGAERVRALILRVGDPAGLLAPYHAEPEALLLRALAGLPGLPVPTVHAWSDDLCLIGAPFLVTGRVDGDTPMPWKGDGAQRSTAENLSLAQDFADGLAALHGFDWRPTPLARLWPALPADDVARAQVRHWAAHAGLDTDAAAQPQLHYARRWLERHAPPAQHVTVVHGDYRVGNFLQVGGRISAVLDWELAHAGDPHEDIAWAGLRIFAAGTPLIGGLFDREAFVARYEARTGTRVDPAVVRYYEVLGLFKSAAMLVGATRRLESGMARDARLGSMGFQLASTLVELFRLISEAR